jgi:[lysine-biosynthesis-protein LysW]---L-2-aminoadipate ligase
MNDPKTVKKIKIGVLCTRIRGDEKLLFEEIRQRDDCELIKINPEHYPYLLTGKVPEVFYEPDVIIDRCINHSVAQYISKILHEAGILIINSPKLINICGDKLLTSLYLETKGVPTAKVKVAYSEKSALKAIEEMGYPCVLKPAVGSWGRLISKVESKTSAEAILEHKAVLGTYHHSIFYIQEYIEKPQRDIRAFVIDGKCIAAIYRYSEHWITNTARGGKATGCEITDEMKQIAKAAQDAIGPGVIALDLFEVPKTKDVPVDINDPSSYKLIINEINHTMEFKNSITTSGVNIPGKMVDYLIKKAKEKIKN